MKEIVGIDEVGRGAVAGPVVVAAVVIPQDSLVRDIESLFPKGLRDSKQATQLQRETISAWVLGYCYVGIGSGDDAYIEREGIQKALCYAAGQAIEQVAKLTKITHVEADAGLFHPFEDIYPTTRTVKADETIVPVMLASHVAKVSRDNLMRKLALEYPMYGWEKNVGYGTKYHFESLKEHGLTPYHRQSFLKRL